MSVYLGRDQQRKRVELRVRVHGALNDATAKRDQLLAQRQPERNKLAAGVYGKTMAELLDRYFAVWQKTPRKGHLPARITAYHRDRLRSKNPDGVRQEVWAHLLPTRRLRSQPRVVKRKMSNFGVKKAAHRQWPQPTKPPAKAVAIRRAMPPPDP